MVIPVALPCRCCKASSIRCRLADTMVRIAPSVAAAFAVASPRPELPPGMSTFLPLSVLLFCAINIVFDGTAFVRGGEVVVTIW